MGRKKTQKDTSMDESAGISRSSDQDTLTEGPGRHGKLDEKNFE